MNEQELELLNQISILDKDQGYIFEKVTSPQQQFLQLYAHRYILSKKILFQKQVEEALHHLPGSFSHTRHSILYNSLCLQTKIDLTPQKYPILKMLIHWTEYFPKIKNLSQVRLSKIVFQGQFNSSVFQHFEQYIIYLNYIGSDLLKLIRKPRSIQSLDTTISQQDQQKFTFDHLDADDLLEFLIGSLPKVYHNVILKAEIIPPQLKGKSSNLQAFYKNTFYEYYMKSKTFFISVIKTILKILNCLELNQTQQRQLMQISFRYYYLYHSQKKHCAAEIFVNAYNQLDDDVRNALSQQFILFFRIIKKLGKLKFVEFLMQKSQWISKIVAKISASSIVGYSKDNLFPLNTLNISTTLNVSRGKIQSRYFQILDDHSIFYFKIKIISMDITIRLYYLGEIDSSTQTKTLLLEQTKQSQILISSILAVKRGIYLFELDNSYSWINSKTVNYDIVVLHPIEIKKTDEYTWAKSFYDNLPLAEMSRQSIHLLQKSNPKLPIKAQEIGEINKSEGFYNIRIVTKNNIYEFETDDEEKLVCKFNQLIDIHKQIKWMIAGQPLQQGQSLEQMFSKDQSKQTNKQIQQKSKAVKKKEAIPQMEIQRDNDKSEIVKKKVKKVIKNQSQKNMQGSKVEESLARLDGGDL